MVAWAATTSVPNGAFDPQSYLAHVRYLASPELKGRGAGSPELEKAGQYIAEQFRLAGLKLFRNDGYLRPFQLTTDAKLGSKNHLVISSKGTEERLKPETDFLPFNFSQSGSVSAPIVFAGYGITAKEYNYDDYAGLDVKDKFVLILRHEPQELDEEACSRARRTSRRMRSSR